MKLEDATAIKVGSASASKVYVGGTLVWPSNYYYNILNATVNYSSGSTLNAGVVGSNYSGNYAYVTGTVRIQRGQVVISETTEYLVPTVSNTSDFNVIYDYTLGYYIIRGNNLGTSETSAIKSSSVSATYSSSAAYTGLTVTQERNIKTEGTPDVEIYYDPAQTTTSDDNYAFADFRLSRYSTAANGCAARGDSQGALLIINASHQHHETVSQNWTEVTTPHYTYTSGATQTGTPYVSDSGTNTNTTTTTVSDTVTPYFVGSHDGFSFNGNWIPIESEGTEIFTDGRSAVIRGDNGTASATVTIYQRPNVVTAYSAGGITSMTINGSSSPLSISAANQTLSVIVYGYRGATYSSGATGNVSWNTWALSSNQSWASPSSANMTVFVEASSLSSQRSVVISATDPDYPAVTPATFTVNQAAAESHAWVITVPSSKSIEYDETSWYFDVYSTRDGVAYAITTSNVTFQDDTIGLSVSSVVATSEFATYRVYISATQNAGQTIRTATIRVAQSGGYSATMYVRQYYYTSALDGIDVVAASGQWVIGTVKTGSGVSPGGSSYDIRGIVIARRSAPSTTSHITVANIEWRWAQPAQSITYETHDDSVSQDIEASTTVSPGNGHTYYGYYLKTSDYPAGVTPRPFLSITSIRVFSVWEE